MYHICGREWWVRVINTASFWCPNRGAALFMRACVEVRGLRKAWIDTCSPEAPPVYGPGVREAAAVTGVLRRHCFLPVGSLWSVRARVRAASLTWAVLFIRWPIAALIAVWFRCRSNLHWLLRAWMSVRVHRPHRSGPVSSCEWSHLCLHPLSGNRLISAPITSSSR